MPQNRKKLTLEKPMQVKYRNIPVKGYDDETEDGEEATEQRKGQKLLKSWVFFFFFGKTSISMMREAAGEEITRLHVDFSNT